MKHPFTALLCMVSIFALPSTVMAQSKSTGLGENSSEKWQSGECGYAAGCSMAASLGIPACGEMPSYEQAQKDQNSADLSAAIATVQKKQAEANDISASCSKALQNLQQQNSQDSADTSATSALLQKMKQAADDSAASAPDVFTVGRPYTKESAPDQKIPAYTFPQRAMAWGVEHIPAQQTQNTPPEASSTDESAEDGADSRDEDIQAEDQAKINAFSANEEVLQRNIQELNDLMLQQAAQNRIPPRAPVQRSQGPQIGQPQNNNCAGSNATALCSVH